MGKLRVGFVCVTAGWAGSAWGQTLELPGGDMNTRPMTVWMGSSPRTPGRSGDRVFYLARDPNHGEQWWFSDGTAAGTGLLADETAGWSLVGSLGGDAVFSRSGGAVVIGRGTREARPLRSEAPGVPWPEPAIAASVGGRVLMSVPNGSTGLEIWATDGSAAGTGPIPGMQGFTAVQRMIEAGERAYLVAARGPGTQGIWVTDGTAAGTAALSPATARVNAVPQWLAAGGRFYFLTNLAMGGDGLYETEGTAETTRRVEAAGVPMQLLGSIGTELVYTSGSSLKITQGSGAPRTLLTNVSTTATKAAATLGDSAYCFSGGYLVRVWADGTSVRLTPSSVAWADWVVAMPGASSGSVVFGMAGDRYERRGPEVWATDGTAAGTGRIREFGPGASYQSFGVLGVAGEESGTPRAILTLQTSDTPVMVLATDGTAGGTVELSPAVTITGSASPKDAFVRDGVLYADINATATGAERYRCDSTSGVLSMCEEMASGAAGIAREQTLSGPTRTYSVSTNGTTTQPVIRAGAGPEAAAPIVASWPGVNVSPGVVGMGVLTGDRLLFRGPSPIPGGAGYSGGLSTLWASDGTAAGTLALSDYEHLENPQVFFSYGGAGWCFALTSHGGAPGLFRDEPVGPALRAQFPTGETYDPGVVLVGSRLIHKRTSSPSGLLSLDLETGERTVVTSAPCGSLTAFDGAAYFIELTSPTTIRRTDGTEAGTWTAASLPRWSGSRTPKLLAVGPGPGGADRLYFAAADADHGMELWMTDGTAGGTVRVTDLAAGAIDSWPARAVVTEAPRRVCFVADDFVHGREWWSTNGTPEGTRRLTDLIPGAGSTRETWAKAVGRRIFFDAKGPAIGAELWMLSLNCAADFNGDEFLDFFDYFEFAACFEGEGCPEGRDADFNGDGFVDFFDYADFVAAFEAGC